MIISVFEDSHEEIIDRIHRLKTDENRPRLRLENVKTEKNRIIVRLILNACRRTVPAQEKMEMLERLGEILLEEVKPGEISKKIAEETWMSYRWMMKYLPDRFKDEVKSESASAAWCAAARIIGCLSS